MSVDKFGRHSVNQTYAEPGVSVRYVNNNFIRRDGSNDMTGDISLNNNKITDLTNPVNDQDATTKMYVDTKINKSGDTMSGSLNMSNNKITNLADPTNPQDAVTRSYVKSFTRSTFLRLDGTNSMEGNFSVNNHNITNLGHPIASRDAVNKYYVDTKADTKVNKSGDTMTGDMNMSDNRITDLANPISLQDATTKLYVDSRKPTIAIWAQEVGNLNAGKYQWSFGCEIAPENIGFCMPSSGRILRGSLTSANGENPSRLALVNVTINGAVNSQLILKPNDTYARSTLFSPPIDVSRDDIINFRTYADATATNSIVSLLIELDL